MHNLGNMRNLVKLQEYPDVGGPLTEEQQKPMDVVVNPAHIITMRHTTLPCKETARTGYGYSSGISDKGLDCIVITLSNGGRILAKGTSVEEMLLKMAVESGDGI